MKEINLGKIELERGAEYVITHLDWMIRFNATILGSPITPYGVTSYSSGAFMIDGKRIELDLGERVFFEGHASELGISEEVDPDTPVFRSGWGVEKKYDLTKSVLIDIDLSSVTLGIFKIKENPYQQEE